MVKAHNFWLSPQHSTWQSPNFNCMNTALEPVQLGCLPACVTPGMYTSSASMAMPGFTVPSIPSLKTQLSNEACGLPQCLPPHFLDLLPGTNPYLKENQFAFSYGLGVEAAPNEGPGCQRRFVIFDQSANETRLIYSSFCPPVSKPTTAATKPICGYYAHCEKYAAKTDQVNPAKPKFHEISDENHLNGEESEMHEDTEEINALLYSDDNADDDDDNNDDNDDDDEVKSTGHSPILIGASYGVQEQAGKIMDEVASCDGPNKRQKLLDGGYKTSSPVETANAVQVEGPHGYAESSYAIAQTQGEEMASSLGNKQMRKDKIRTTLKILESIVPGAKDKDPLLVLDESIAYLKSLKLKAKVLGVN